MRLKIGARRGLLGLNSQHFEPGFDIETGSLLQWFYSHLSGGCSYSFVNWEMLSVRPDRGMLTPSH
jgi:hypothetical protein